MNPFPIDLMQLSSLLRRRPAAFADLHGSAAHPSIRGTVRFYTVPGGILTAVETVGLPTGETACDSPIFALHIHEGSQCSGNADDPFADVGSHYNPHACPHPYHAGDLPPLFGANGVAFSVFLTDRFTLPEILGKTVILHALPDDLHTQPSGASGAKMACGRILPSPRTMR